MCASFGRITKRKGPHVLIYRITGWRKIVLYFFAKKNFMSIPLLKCFFLYFFNILFSTYLANLDIILTYSF